MLHVKCVQQGRKQQHFKKAVIAIVVLLTGSIPRQKKIANDFTIRTLIKFDGVCDVFFSLLFFFFFTLSNKLRNVFLHIFEAGERRGCKAH